MVRTRGRPIPQGKISGLDALGFGVILALVSVLMLGLAVTISRHFCYFSIFFYVFIYTIWLKRRTPQNIVIAGRWSIPTCNWLGVFYWWCERFSALILFLIIFMWTPPHFWHLLYTRYWILKAKVPMLPVDGKKTTKRQIMIYSFYLQ